MDIRIFEFFSPKKWNDLVDFSSINRLADPKKLDEIEKRDKVIDDYGALNGLQYIYTFDSLGLSFELQDRLQKHVTGRSVTRDGVTIEWRDLRSLKKDLKTNVQSRRFLGDVYFKEFSEKFKLLN